MNHHHYFQKYFFKGLLAVLFVLALFALTPGLASAQSSCLPQTSCSAGDLPPLTITSITDIKSPCTNQLENGNDANGNPLLEIVVDINYYFTAGANTRYDLGFVVASDGRNILATAPAIPAAVCAKDYLVPPLTSTRPLDQYNIWPNTSGQFWDAEDTPGLVDECGDISKYDTATRTAQDVMVTCIDTNGNGQIDVSVCQIYDNNQQNDCGATNPGTGSKCDCYRLDLPITPTAIEGLSFSASSRALPVGLALSGLGLVLLGGVLLSIYLRRRAHA